MGKSHLISPPHFRLRFVCVRVCVRDIKMDLRLITHEGCIFYQATVGTLPRNRLTLPQLASPGLPALLHCMHILFIRSSTRAAQLLNLCLAHSHHRPPSPHSALLATFSVHFALSLSFALFLLFHFGVFHGQKNRLLRAALVESSKLLANAKNTCTA